MRAHRGRAPVQSGEAQMRYGDYRNEARRNHCSQLRHVGYCTELEESSVRSFAAIAQLGYEIPLVLENSICSLDINYK
jgi:hypothetical protein